MISNGGKCHAEDPHNCRFHHTGRYGTGAWSEEAIAARTPKKKVDIPAPFDSRRAQSLLKYAFQKPMELVKYAPPELSDIELKEDAHNLPVEKAIAATMPFADVYGSRLAEVEKSVMEAKQKTAAQRKALMMANFALWEKSKGAADDDRARIKAVIEKNAKAIENLYKSTRDAECRTYAAALAFDGNGASSYRNLHLGLVDGLVDPISVETLKCTIPYMFAPDLLPTEKVKIEISHDSRSESSPSLIRFSKIEDAETLAHEMAHVIEYGNAHVLKRCCEFLEHRCKGEKPQKLAWLDAGNFNDSEVGRKDNFFHAYCGKDYLDERGNRVSTEILSMGVEMMLTHPQMFCEKDKEYFSFVLNLMHGRL